MPLDIVGFLAERAVIPPYLAAMAYSRILCGVGIHVHFVKLKLDEKLLLIFNFL